MLELLPFSRPILLLLLIVPILLIAWIWRRESGRVAMPFDYSDYQKGRWWSLFINIAETMPALILAIAILILAGPQQLSEPKSRKALTNIEFCVDVSGSMTARFGEGNRYDASMAAIDDFLSLREGDAFGLTFFGNEVLKWVPLTNDVTAIRCAPPFMNPTNPNHPRWLGGTAIGKGLTFCRKELLQRDEGDRMIVLVSDGQSYDLGDGMEVGKKLADDNIVVFAIHIGGGNIPDAIVNVTALTGGEAFEPGDPESMKEVFDRIDGMQQAKMEKVAAETLDYFFPWTVAGLSLSAFGLVSLFGLRYTPW